MKSSLDKDSGALPQNPAKKRINTNLYELISAIYDEVGAGEEMLIPQTVINMIESGRLKFVGDLKVKDLRGV
jgi:hypothetical protein